MPRGITITPSDAAAVTFTPKPASITIADEPSDAGGDGVPNVRNAIARKIECEVVCDSASPTAATLLALRNSTLKTADHTVAATIKDRSDGSDVIVTIEDASVQVSISGDGVMVAKITAKGNPKSDEDATPAG